MFTVAHMDPHMRMCTSTFTLVLDQFTFLPTFFPVFFFSLIYIVCEWLLNRVEGLVEELGNGPFLRTQRNRSRAAYVGIWMVNRWITQSGVFLCRLAGIVLWYLCVREKESERWGHGGVGIHPSPKYYAVVKNICNARRYFEKYLKKFNTVLTFCWAFVNRFTLHLIWRRVREDLCYCIMLLILNYVNLFILYIYFDVFIKIFFFLRVVKRCFTREGDVDQKRS